MNPFVSPYFYFTIFVVGVILGRISMAVQVFFAQNSSPRGETLNKAYELGQDLKNRYK